MAHRKLLLVEDKEEIRSQLSGIIADEGYEVIAAKDGEQAWELFQDSIFLVVITDLRMPRKDGIEVLEEIKRHHPPTRVIIITAEGDYQDAIKALRLDADDYIDKGNSAFYKELLNAIKSAFDRAESQVETERELLAFLTHALRSSLIGGSQAAQQALRLTQKLMGDRYKESEAYKVINNMITLDSIFESVDKMLEVYSLYVTEPAELSRKWEEDLGGSVPLSSLNSLVLKQTLGRLLFEESNLSQLKSLLVTRGQPDIKDVRESFLNQVLLAEEARPDESPVQDWLSAFFPILSSDINVSDVYFRADSIRFSLLFAICSEITYNALKYTDGREPIRVEWSKQGGRYIFSCRNTFSPSSTSRTGSQKGLVFIERLIKNLKGIHLNQSSDGQTFAVQLVLAQAILNRGETA